MNNTNTTRLIAKLVKLTADSELDWIVADAPKSLTEGSDDVIPIFLKAHYKDKWVCVYEKRSQEYTGEHDLFYWNENNVFAVMDNSDRILMESYEKSPALHDLVNVVRNKAAGIDDMLNDLLED